MTTIAARLLGNGWLEVASDRQVTGERSDRLLVPKVVKFPAFYMGGAGALTFLNRVLYDETFETVEELNDGVVRNALVKKVRPIWRDAKDDIGEDADFSLLIASLDGIWVIDSDMSVVRYEKFTAIGSGAAYALGAMQTGAGVIEAVEAARKYDMYTGGDVDHFLLN